MPKKLRCGDILPGCNYEGVAETEEELLAGAKEHAAKAHGISDIPPMILLRVKAAIKDV